jgi:hypothetical protein
MYEYIQTTFMKQPAIPFTDIELTPRMHYTYVCTQTGYAHTASSLGSEVFAVMFPVMDSTTLLLGTATLFWHMRCWQSSVGIGRSNVQSDWQIAGCSL